MRHSVDEIWNDARRALATSSPVCFASTEDTSWDIDAMDTSSSSTCPVSLEFTDSFYDRVTLLITPSPLLSCTSDASELNVSLGGLPPSAIGCALRTVFPAENAQVSPGSATASQEPSTHTAPECVDDLGLNGQVPLAVREVRDASTQTYVPRDVSPQFRSRNDDLVQHVPQDILAENAAAPASNYSQPAFNQDYPVQEPYVAQDPGLRAGTCEDGGQFASLHNACAQDTVMQDVHAQGMYPSVVLNQNASRHHEVFNQNAAVRPHDACLNQNDDAVRRHRDLNQNVAGRPKDVSNQNATVKNYEVFSRNSTGRSHDAFIQDEDVRRHEVFNRNVAARPQEVFSQNAVVEHHEVFSQNSAVRCTDAFNQNDDVFDQDPAFRRHEVYNRNVATGPQDFLNQNAAGRRHDVFNLNSAGRRPNVFGQNAAGRPQNLLSQNPAVRSHDVFNEQNAVGRPQDYFSQNAALRPRKVFRQNSAVTRHEVSQNAAATPQAFFNQNAAGRRHNVFHQNDGVFSQHSAARRHDVCSHNDATLSDTYTANPHPYTEEPRVQNGVFQNCDPHAFAKELLSLAITLRVIHSSGMLSIRTQ